MYIIIDIWREWHLGALSGLYAIVIVNLRCVSSGAYCIHGKAQHGHGTEWKLVQHKVTVFIPLLTAAILAMPQCSRATTSLPPKESWMELSLSYSGRRACVLPWVREGEETRQSWKHFKRSGLLQTADQRITQSQPQCISLQAWNCATINYLVWNRRWCCSGQVFGNYEFKLISP